MMYVLMALVSFGTPSNGATSINQEFTSEAACVQAGNSLKQAEAEIWGKFKVANYVFFRCVPK